MTAPDTNPAESVSCDPDAPHGRCDCNGLTCCRGHGPAAYRVTREGVVGRMKVCTWCDLSSDQDREILVTSDEPIGPYLRFDPLGAFCLWSQLA
jgi:hypothetical protein